MVETASTKAQRHRPELSPSSSATHKMKQDESDVSASFSKVMDAPPASRLNRIAHRAHEIYEARGGENGRELEDWLQAEREIDSE